jgi:hypothetical protein
MLKKTLLFLSGIFFATGLCYALDIKETENLVFSLESYLRNDVVSFKNVVDLDSATSDDTTTYLGIDYSLGARLQFKDSGPEFYLKLERNGPTDYDAPLFVHNTLMTSGGTIEHYRNDDLLPQLEEFWVDSPLGSIMRFKIGLYAYEVGNNFSLGGAYENYGFSLYRKLENFSWRLYYCRPEIIYKNRLGPRIRQDEEQGIKYNHNATNFFATDVKFRIGKSSFQPYIGVLADYTVPEKRDNAFTAPIKKDILGTFGMAWNFKQDKLALKTELAHNFGRAISSDPGYKDIEHSGYMAYLDLDYGLGKFTPSLQFLLCSGNKVALDAAADTYLTSGKNRAFSTYSSLNKNLWDSISANHTDICPIVAMGSGYGLNYGVLRPETFAASDFDNIIIQSLGMDCDISKNLRLGLYGYALRSFAKGVGTLNGEAKRLSAELGYEADLFIDYKLNKNVLLSVLGGCFVPGKYYKEERDDASGSLLSPCVRQDGKADNAYQIELAVEFSF